MHLDVNLTLTLPRDELSIPVVRRLTSALLEGVGVARDCRDDIELALTEACTNVLEHSKAEDEYEVSVRFDPKTCTIGIADAGAGFDDRAVPAAADDAESGRGIQLMRALVDDVRFLPRAELGTVVCLEKNLQFDEDHPLRVQTRKRISR